MTLTIRNTIQRYPSVNVTRCASDNDGLNKRIGEDHSYHGILHDSESVSKSCSLKRARSIL